MFDMQGEWTWNISNNYMIKSDVCIKLKYIQISLDIYQHISYHAESKKEEINISTIKTQWSCIIIKLIWTIFAYNQN